MIVRAAALLLLGAILGFAIGRVIAPGERAHRHAMPAPVAPLTPASEGADAQGAARHEALPPPVGNASDETVEAAAQPDEVVLPTGRAEGEWDDLVVDFEGFQGPHTAWVVLRTMTGGIEQEEQGADDDGVARVNGLWPGTYDVWWVDNEGTRLGTRARIEEGQVTRLRAVDHRSPAPLPKGVGALRLEVMATWGGGLAGVTVYIRQREGSRDLSVETDPRGRASAILAPGRYVVYFADYEREVVVHEGRTTLHRIEHRREGDLVLVSDRPGNISIEPVGRQGYYAAVVVEETVEVMPYLLEGEYDVVLEDLVSLGRVAVHAGRTTRFRCEVPTGGVAVRLLRPGAEKLGEADVKIRRVIDGRETTRGIDRNEPSYQLNLPLPAGRYVVTASAKECAPVFAEIDVGDGVVDLTLELRSLR